MAWHAQPSGGYAFSSTENYDNSMEIYGILNGQGFDVAAVAGVCGNAQHESGLNPWRWQNDTVSSHLGYGLLQWTPSTGYTSLPGATPNFSTSTTTAGATPEDGARQMQAFYENNPAKWHDSCWRTYWNKTTYSAFYDRTRYILNTWGNGAKITLAQFATINDPSYAADCFLACFEGPTTPNYLTREQTAGDFYQRFTGVTPPTPPTPPHPPQPGGNMPIWLICKEAMKWRL